MSPNSADGMANSVDPDQTAPLIWVCTVCPGISGSALFAQAYLSENLGSLRYLHTRGVQLDLNFQAYHKELWSKGSCFVKIISFILSLVNR